MKRLLITMLVLVFCLSSVSVFAKSDNAKNEKTTQSTTAATTEQDGTTVAPTDETTNTTTTDNGTTVTNDETNTTTDDGTAVTNDESNTTTDDGTAVTNDDSTTVTDDDSTAVTDDEDTTSDQPKDKAEKRKIAKEKLKEKIQERKEARVEAKEYFKEVRQLFKDADPATKKEILKQIAQAKRDLKDYSIGVFIKGLAVDFEKYDNVKPVIKENRTLVPVRAITETFGAKVAWDEATNTITITKDDTTIVMVLDNKVATVNGKEVTLDVAPTTENGRTLVPLRFISETFSLKVDWDDDSQTAVVGE